MLSPKLIKMGAGERPLGPPQNLRVETLKADIKPVGTFHGYVKIHAEGSAGLQRSWEQWGGMGPS